MSALTFNHYSTPHRRPAVRRAATTRVAKPMVVELSTPAIIPARLPLRPATLILVGAIAALHGAVIWSLSGSVRPAAPPQPVPVTITFTQPRVEPPPPPPPPPPKQSPPPRVKAVATPRIVAPAPAVPVVAPETPLVQATADAVEVARAAEPPPPPPPAPEPVTEPKGYAGYLRNPAPEYPLAAQKRGLEGQVVLKVHVLASGSPDKVTVAKSSGHAILDEAAIKAVLQWAFAPAKRGSTPIDGWVQVPLNFKI